MNMLNLLNLVLSRRETEPEITVDPAAVILIIVIAIVIIVFLAILFRWGLLWIRAALSGAGIGLFEIVAMSLRKVDPKTIVEAKIALVKAGISIPTAKLEAHYLAGGNVVRVARSIIAANKANIGLGYDQGMAIDLAGRDLLDAVQTSVRPKIIGCPDPRGPRPTLDAVAKDGIQLRVKAKVTVRTHLPRLVGGATEETIIARVGEGIVSSIGSSGSYKDVLENPDKISKTVLEKGLDSQTAFEIVSIDIADVDVGENVGAKLRIEQAEADMKMARAEAEKRRALAVAREQEMKALEQEYRAQVTQAEIEIPRAIATAFREGKLGIMDYYGLRNIQADTAMRSAIASTGSGSEEPKKHML
jgi:uncharacterized protein YqfA (UPF0365 family)